MLEKLSLDRKLLRYLNFGVILVSILLVLFGCLNIYSATVAKLGFYYVKLQLAWLAIGIAVVYVIMLIDYSVLYNYAALIYWFSVAFLLYNDLTSKAIKGASAWIRIGSRAIQPSEFARLGMIIILAKKLEDMEGNINNFKNFCILTFYAAIPMMLIVIQPDMGMTMVCFFIVLGIYFVSGLNMKVIFGGMTAIAASIALVWNSGILPAYWKSRLTIFLNPEADELGYGLQLIYSKIDIGSGGLLGSGVKFGRSSAVAFGQFVPENHTDFIFSVVGEKWGYVGSILLLIMYSILLYNILSISRKSKDLFGSIICVGIFSSFLFSIIQNIGMTIGVMPITGITLPFMSYGGSSLLTNFIALGLVVNIGMRRKKINF